MRDALSYVEQWRLVGWTAQLNEDKGVAPSTEAVLQQLEMQRLDERTRRPHPFLHDFSAPQTWLRAAPHFIRSPSSSIQHCLTIESKTPHHHPLLLRLLLS